MNKIRTVLAIICVVLTSWLKAATPKMITFSKGEQTIYLFGSIHAGKSEFYPLPSYVLSRFNDADAVAFEIDMTDTISVGLGLASKQMKSVFTDGKKLSDYLSQGDIEKIEQISGKAVALNLKPAEYILDLMSLSIEQSSLSISQGVDMFLLNRVIRKRKAIIGLETIASQIALFYDMPVEKQAAILLSGLKEWENQAPMLEKMAELWMNGDQKLFKFAISEMKKQDPDGEFIEQLLYQRNQNMADTLVLKQESGMKKIFCVIGAMHIYGDRSVTDYLLKSGYKVTEEIP